MQCTKPCKVSHAQTLPAGECSTTCKLCSTALAKNYCRLSLRGNSDLNSDQACKGHCVSLCNIPQFQPFLITANIGSAVARITIYVVKPETNAETLQGSLSLNRGGTFCHKNIYQPFLPLEQSTQTGLGRVPKKEFTTVSGPVGGQSFPYPAPCSVTVTAVPVVQDINWSVYGG